MLVADVGVTLVRHKRPAAVRTSRCTDATWKYGLYHNNGVQGIYAVDSAWQS